MFLTIEELAELTGCKRAQNQIRWLVQNGYKFERNVCGKPKVLRAAVEKRLGAMAAKPARQPCFEPVLKVG
jgi:hypothetical protein